MLLSLVSEIILFIINGTLYILGIFLGVSGAYVTVFDEVLNQLRYDKYQQQVGYLGLAIQVTCIIGLLFIGRWLDWTKTF